MRKACKGIHRVVCEHQEIPCPQKQSQVIPACLDCEHSQIEILDFDNKIIFATKMLRIEKPVKQAKAKKEE